MFYRFGIACWIVIRLTMYVSSRSVLFQCTVPFKLLCWLCCWLRLSRQQQRSSLHFSPILPCSSRQHLYYMPCRLVYTRHFTLLYLQSWIILFYQYSTLFNLFCWIIYRCLWCYCLFTLCSRVIHEHVSIYLMLCVWYRVIFRTKWEFPMQYMYSRDVH